MVQSAGGDRVMVTRVTVTGVTVMGVTVTPFQQATRLSTPVTVSPPSGGAWGVMYRRREGTGGDSDVGDGAGG